MPEATEIVDEQARLDAVGETAGSVAEPTKDETLAKAEADRDTDTSLQIKGDQLAAMMRDK